MTRPGWELTGRVALLRDATFLGSGGASPYRQGEAPPEPEAPGKIAATEFAEIYFFLLLRMRVAPCLIDLT